MTRMNAILEIDGGNRLAVVQPGVVNLDSLPRSRPGAFFYAPDPSSYHLASEIGAIGLGVHRAIMQALDPAGLFNPGSMFSPAG